MNFSAFSVPNGPDLVVALALTLGNAVKIQIHGIVPLTDIFHLNAHRPLRKHSMQTHPTRTITSIAELRKEVAELHKAGKRIGCVPTMGALHAGHISLMQQARAETDVVIVTIFVNPTQFGPNEDFTRYPRPWESDLEQCQAAGVDLVFRPEVPEIYLDNPQVRVCVGDLAARWDGAHRPGHFDGVVTIVTKLFNLCQPDVAFFGAKDFQQQCIIRAMCRDLNVPVEIVTCPTIRESSGLAMSSRNAYLSPEEKTQALAISSTLFEVQQGFAAGGDLNDLRQRLYSRLANAPGLKLDYAVIVDPVELKEVATPQKTMVALVAARVGQTRLIDNMLLESTPAQGS